MKKRFTMFALACLILTLAAGASGTAGAEIRTLPWDTSGGAPLQAWFDKNVTTYDDPSIHMEYFLVTSPRNEWNVVYHYALITVKDPAQLRTVCMDGNFVSGVKGKPRVMAQRVNAVVAVNGDFTAAFTGNKANSYVLRMGKVYRESAEPDLDILLVDEDGDFHVLPREENLAEVDKTTVDGKRVMNAFQFGPALVIDGEKVADEKLVDPTRSPTDAHPESDWPQRMCIAQVGPLQYMVLCCRNGLSLPRLRDLCMSIADCRVVYTLDGGNSAQLIIQGTKINNVKGEERPVTDIIYFASAWFPDGAQ